MNNNFLSSWAFLILQNFETISWALEHFLILRSFKKSWVCKLFMWQLFHLRKISLRYFLFPCPHPSNTLIMKLCFYISITWERTFSVYIFSRFYISTKNWIVTSIMLVIKGRRIQLWQQFDSQLKTVAPKCPRI